MSKGSVGLLGATSLVGECLIPLLAEGGWRVTAFSRRAQGQAGEGVEWLRLPTSGLPAHFGSGQQLSLWICVAPIWVLPQYFEMLETCGARRVVALSSTSRFTKADSSDLFEHETAAKLAEGEQRLQIWAETRGIDWVILRPTLIYGRGKDKNISEIARFIRRFAFFPLFGTAKGLRQPVHAEDVASACVAALRSPAAANHAYNLSGGETLAYHEMVERVFFALEKKPRMLRVPLLAFRIATALLRLLSGKRNLTMGMAERMNHDLVFEHSKAVKDFGFSPREFLIRREDLP